MKSSTSKSHHLLAELHWGWEGFGVSTEDVAKVDVNQVTQLGEQEVVQVPVAHAEQVGDHTIAS